MQAGYERMSASLHLQASLHGRKITGAPIESEDPDLERPPELEDRLTRAMEAAVARRESERKAQ